MTEADGGAPRLDATASRLSWATDAPGGGQGPAGGRRDWRRGRRRDWRRRRRLAAAPPPPAPAACRSLSIARWSRTGWPACRRPRKDRTSATCSSIASRADHDSQEPVGAGADRTSRRRHRAGVGVERARRRRAAAAQRLADELERDDPRRRFVHGPRRIGVRRRGPARADQAGRKAAAARTPSISGSRSRRGAATSNSTSAASGSTAASPSSRASRRRDASTRSGTTTPPPEPSSSNIRSARDGR